MTDLLFGVDGGGTKTHACLSTLSGDVVGFGVAGGGNWEGIGLDALADVMADVLDQCFQTFSQGTPADVVAATFSMAGMDWPSDQDRIRSCIEPLALGAHATIVNDSFGALRAGTSTSWGLVNNAGTGGVTAGRNRSGRVFRTMAEGWGEGNGSGGLVVAAIHEMALAQHGQVEPTKLTDAFLSAADLHDPMELFEAMARGGWEPGSELAPLVLDLADSGDAAAVRVTTSTAEQHARDVVGVARVLEMFDEETELVLAGSVHNRANPIWAGAFGAIIGSELPLATLVTLKVPPVVGAVLLSIESLGIDGESITQQLSSGATAFLSKD